MTELVCLFTRRLKEPDTASGQSSSTAIEGRPSKVSAVVGAGAVWQFRLRCSMSTGSARFSDFGDVRREIEAETARVCSGSRSLTG